MRKLLRFFGISAAYGAVGLTLLALVGIAISSTQKATAPKSVSYIDVGKNIAGHISREEGRARQVKLSRDVYMAEDADGCVSAQSYTEMVALSKQKTAKSDAQRKRLFDKGTCKTLATGQSVFVSREDPLAGIYAVLPTGETQGYWVPQASVGGATPSTPIAKALSKNDWMPSGSIGVMGQMGIACRSKKVFEELGDIAGSGDEEAFERARLGLILAGQCEWITDGTVLYITDTAMFSGMYQVRPKGRADKFWTFQKWVRSS